MTEIRALPRIHCSQTTTPDNSMGITGEPCVEPRYHPSMDEQPRPDANTDEHAFVLTVEESAARYEAAGHSRTLRAIQKYCARGDLDSQKEETAFGQRYRITPASVARHIAQIVEVSQTSIREQPRPDAAVRSLEQSQEKPLELSAPVREQPRSDAFELRYVARLEGEVEFLRGQVGTKDAQIKELTERSRETNLLIGGLQRLLAPLLGSPDPHPPNPVERKIQSDDAPQI
jgi:hypothetical protein